MVFPEHLFRHFLPDRWSPGQEQTCWSPREAKQSYFFCYFYITTALAAADRRRTNSQQIICSSKTGRQKLNEGMKI